MLATEQVGQTFHLLDNRGWELVTPVDKGGGEIAAPGALFGGGDIQAAAGAPALTFGSAAVFGSAVGAPPASQYVSRRNAVGWVTENVSAPLDSGAYGDDPAGPPYRVFSADLSRALLFGGLPCRGGLEACPAPNPPLAGSGAPFGYMAFYLREGGGSFSSLLGAADVAHSAVAPQAFELAFAAASPDLSHVVLSSCAALSAGATEVLAEPGRCDPDAANLYERSAGGLRAINLLPGATTTAPGATIAAPLGAVSDDGSRVYWSDGEDLYLRDGAETVQVDQAAGGGGVFQAASADGSIGFFAKAGHLFRYDALAKSALDLTPSGGVQGVLGASADGSYVYYQDGAGLWLWHAGATALVVSGAEAALTSDFPPATGTARVSADGLHLAFLSEAELSTPQLPGYDNVDANTNQRDAELFLYGPPPAGGPARLVCVSCNPTGERPVGASTIPGAVANGSTVAYKPRVLSANGNRVFFDSDDSLDEADTNSNPDVYEWEADGVGSCRRSSGCLSLVSSGKESHGGASFLDATVSGSDVFFLTKQSLVGADPGSIDAYDARIDGGLPEFSDKPICVGDSCQPLPSPPDDPTPGTLTPSPGNPKLRFFGPKPRKHRGKRHRGAHRARHGGRGQKAGRPR